MLLNNLLLILFIVAMGYVLVRAFRKTAVKETGDEFVNPYTIDYLYEYVNKTLSYTKQRDLTRSNFTKAEYDREVRKKRELREAENRAIIGDTQAKRYMKSLILSIISDARREYPITKENIDKVIPFNSPDEMDVKDKFETLLYIYWNSINLNDPKKRKYEANAFTALVRDYGLLKTEEGADRHIITKEQIDAIYLDVMKHTELSYEDKRAILSQVIYEKMGNGVIDSLLDMSIDEIQGGVSGIPTGFIQSSNLKPMMKNAKFSYESVWVIVAGVNVHLDFLSFGTLEELVRVTHNISKYDANKVLSRNDSQVAAGRLDMSRVTAMRPPSADSYCFFIRKFDSVPSIAPENLLHDTNANVVISLLKWLVKGELNIAVCGDQGSGKTTLLKSIVRFIREDYSIRTQELIFELNLRMAYPDRNIIGFRETATISAQEELDFQKKTSGMVVIPGEVADEESASWVIQSAGVGSRQTIFTGHMMSLYQLILYFRNATMNKNNYRNERAADLMTANAINIYVKMSNENGVRRIDYISEIIPDEEQPYRAKVDNFATETKDELSKKTMANLNDYFERETDRVSYKERRLVEFDREQNCYRLLQLPTIEKQERMWRRMSEGSRNAVMDDIAYLQSVVESR